jgi:hypothetical protein
MAYKAYTIFFSEGLFNSANTPQPEAPAQKEKRRILPTEVTRGKGVSRR